MQSRVKIKKSPRLPTFKCQEAGLESYSNANRNHLSKRRLTQSAQLKSKENPFPREGMLLNQGTCEMCLADARVFMGQRLLFDSMFPIAASHIQGGATVSLQLFMWKNNTIINK